MNVPHLLSADLSAAGPVPFRGFVDRAHPEKCVEGWAADVSEPGRAVVVELRAGEAVVATAVADRPRPDIQELGFARGEAGFRFEAADLRSAMAGRPLDTGAPLSVRIAGRDFALRSRDPLPTPGAFGAASAEPPAADEPPPDHAAEAAAARDELPAALRSLAARAAGLRRAGPAPNGAAAGHVECLSGGGEADDGLVWFLGWTRPGLPLLAPVLAVSADGAEHPSAFVAAPHGGRADLPDGASGVAGALRTDWRPAPGDGGIARLVFLEGDAAGAHLRLREGPTLLTAPDCAAWIEDRGEALGGPFAEPLLRLLDAAAERAADGFGGLMRRGARARAAGNAAAALDLFRAALALDGRSARARVAAAGALRDLGRADEADDACRTLLADEPGHAGALMALGHSLRGRGNPAGALPLFERALAGEPRAAWARMAVADTLADLGRLDEAEAACRAVAEDEPNNFGALMSLGHVAKARGDRRAAAGWFERAALAAPDAAAPRAALADALRDRGDFAAARGAAEALVALHPNRADGWMSLGHTERRAGRHEEALRAFGRASALSPDDPAPLVQMAVEERRLGRPEACARLLERALEADGEDVEALLQLGEHLRLAGALDRALEAFRRAMAAPRPAPWAHLAASQVLVDLGETDEALRTLDAAEARLGRRADVAAKRAELLRRTGDWPRARAAAAEAERAWPDHFGVWFERAHHERMRGGKDALEAFLRAAPAGNTHEEARVELLRGLLAAERWDFDEARARHARSVELNPDDGWPRVCLAQARLLLLDTEGAREELRALARLDLSAAKMQGRSANISQTHLGQLLDEFTLDARALAGLRAAYGLAPAERVGALLALVRAHPEYTPAAIGLLTALRRSGRLSVRSAAVAGPAAADASPIPRAVAQYWDDPGRVPADLGRIMASWGGLYPGFALRRFDDKEARAFLARFHGPEVQAAYRRSRQPAQKADLFRLAYLWSAGGYYADADDRLVGDFEDLRFPGARLVLYQEDFGTIGNNMIGAVPGHPLVGRALRLAVEAVNRGDTDILWLSTGPGLLTRAFADLLVEPGREPLAALDDAVVLEHGELMRTVSIHCLVGYKNTDRHWSRTAFGRRNAAAAADASPPAPRPEAPAPGNADARRAGADTEAAGDAGDGLAA